MKKHRVLRNILIDIVCAGLALVIFALFHHVLPRQQQSLGIVISDPNGNSGADSAPTLTLPEDAVMIAPLLRETADPFLAMAEYQGKTMTLEAEDGLAVHGDRASLERLMSTLLDNAVKYASGDGNIIVRARAEGRHALLTVANDVPEPLTQEQCRQLFDRFYRADPSRNKDKQGGFGIGLAIAAAIVEKHGGSITAGMEDGRLKFTCRMMRSIGRQSL